MGSGAGGLSCGRVRMRFPLKGADSHLKTAGSLACVRVISHGVASLADTKSPKITMKGQLVQAKNADVCCF